MIDLGCPKLIRRVLPVVSSADRPLKLVLEPWADEFDLQPNQELIVVLVGPETGEPSLCLGKEWLAVYGWPDSEGFVFQDNRRIGEFSSDVSQIVQRELKAVRGLRRMDREIEERKLVELFEAVDAKMSFGSFGSAAIREIAAGCAANVGDLLCRMLEPTESTAKLVWRVCTEIFQVGGYTLPQADPRRLHRFLKSRAVERKSWHKILQRLAVSICPADASPERPRSKTRQPSSRRSQRE